MTSSAPDSTSKEFELNTQQRYLQERLGKYQLLKKTGDFGTIYLSALLVMESATAAKVQMSAHCLREIMEKLPETHAGKAATKSPDEVQALKNLKEKWNVIIAHTDWQDLSWAGKNIDGQMAKFLNDFDKVYKNGLITNGYTRADLRKKFVTEMYQFRGQLSVGFVEAICDRWKVIEIFMQNTSHFSNTTEIIFKEHLQKFETLMFELFKQPVVENMDEIDALIAQGEKTNGN